MAFVLPYFSEVIYIYFFKVTKCQYAMELLYKLIFTFLLIGNVFTFVPFGSLWHQDNPPLRFYLPKQQLNRERKAKNMQAFTLDHRKQYALIRQCQAGLEEGVGGFEPSGLAYTHGVGKLDQSARLRATLRHSSLFNSKLCILIGYTLTSTPQTDIWGKHVDSEACQFMGLSMCLLYPPMV